MSFTFENLLAINKKNQLQVLEKLTSKTCYPVRICNSRKAAIKVVVVLCKYYMEVLKNEILSFSTFQAMHLTESQLVDNDTEEL